MPSTIYCTWSLSICIRLSTVYPEVSSGRFFASSMLRSGWCNSCRTFMITWEADCLLVAIWLTSSVWKWMFTKALAWAPDCSSWFWKPPPKSFVHGVRGNTCKHMTRLSSLNRWKNCKRSRCSARPTWMERDFGSSWAKPRSWYLGRWSMWFCSLAKPLWRVSQGHQHKFRFLC